MGSVIWWIGAVHVALYATLGTACALWAGSAAIAKWSGNTGIIIMWYVERLRAKKKKGRIVG